MRSALAACRATRVSSSWDRRLAIVRAAFAACADAAACLSRRAWPRLLRSSFPEPDGPGVDAGGRETDE